MEGTTTEARDKAAMAEDTSNIENTQPAKRKRRYRELQC